MGIDASYARDFFVKRGYSAGGAAGIVGNLMQESGGSGKLNTAARNPGDGRDGSDSIGIAQWNSGRARALKAFAAGQGKSWQDGDVQLAFVDKELREDHPSIAAYLKGNVTPAQGAKSFIGFERPKGWNTGGGEIGNRVKYANQVAGSEVGVGTAGPAMAAGANDAEMSNETAGGSGSSSGATSSSVPEAIDKQTAAQAASAEAARATAQAAEDANREATFDSMKDYAGRFIIVALGIVFVAGGVYMFAARGGPAKVVRKALA